MEWETIEHQKKHENCCTADVPFCFNTSITQMSMQLVSFLYAFQALASPLILSIKKEKKRKKSFMFEEATFYDSVITEVSP